MAVTAFREGYLSADLEDDLVFESLEARRIRYAIYGAFFQNDAYRRVHNWSTSYKHQYGLYKYIRNLYNPAARLANFYSQNLWGGHLDRTAGNSGAIPIETKSPKEEALRTALAQLWRDSNFARLKDVITLRGAVEGDTILRVVDDVKHEQVFFQRLDPSTIASLDLDHQGNVKGYVLEEKRSDPSKTDRLVDYREVVSRNKDFVVFETFLNGKLFAWNGRTASWEIEYGFVPMVLIKHIDVGLPWGFSELHTVRSKIHEVDDLASMITDQIRKYLHPVWVMKGVRTRNDIVSLTTSTADHTGRANTRPQPAREELSQVFGIPKDADPQALVANLNLGDAISHLDRLLKELERELPELQVELWATSVSTGRALRIARERVSSKLLQRREGYDEGLVRLQKMGISIGAMRSYKGFEGFSAESFERGDLDHQIAERPAFKIDPEDAAIVEREFWTAAGLAVGLGVDLKGYLKSQGFSEEQIIELIPEESELEIQPTSLEGEPTGD